MKKALVILLAALMVLSLAACKKPAPSNEGNQDQTQTQNPEQNQPDTSVVLEDTNHAAWVAHGQYLLIDGTENSWNGKDTEIYEASALKAISLDDVKAIDPALFDTLCAKDVKYLYTIDLVFGTNDAGWPTNCMIDGKLNKANGSYAFKIAQCTVDVDGDNKVYAEDQWISDPKTAYAESLTPATLFMPVWQEESDENGFSWASNPVVIGGAGVYTLIVAQYKTVSAAGTPGYGIALIQKEQREGIPYEEIIPFVATDHTYGIVGSFEGSNWGEGADIEMTADGENSWTGEVDLKAGDEFKVRADSDWTYNWGNEGENFKCEADGTYVVTITFDGETPTVTVNAK